MAGPTAFEPVRTTLRDGTLVHVRQIEPTDKDRMVAAFDRLSEQSRYRRFLAPVPRLSDAQLRYLTEVDHDTHEAIVALADEPGRPGVGVARYVRLPDEPEVAEAAVTVIDDYQGRGLGTVLLVLLARLGLERGVRRFRAYVLEENTPMREVLERLGAEAHHDSPGLLRMDTPLPEDADVVLDTPAGQVLRAVAEGTIPEVATERRTGELAPIRVDEGGRDDAG